MWGGLAAFIFSLCTPLVVRILAALGLGMVSYLGLNVLVTTLIDHVTSSYSGIGATTAQLLNLCGFGAAVSIIGSGLITKAGLMAVSKIGSLVGG